MRTDVPTVAGIACVCVLLQVGAHEVFGHGLTALALGAHVYYVTNISCETSCTLVLFGALRAPQNSTDLSD